jgi:hypothetical protein
MNKDFFDLNPFPDTGTRIYSENSNIKLDNINELKNKLGKAEKELKSLRAERDDTNTIRSRSNFRLDELIKDKELEVNRLKEEVASRLEGQGKEGDLPDKINKS